MALFQKAAFNDKPIRTSKDGSLLPYPTGGTAFSQDTDNA
jgi:hypothetical protein